MEGNGVTRREFEDLKNDLRDLRNEVRDTRRQLRNEFEELDRTGSRALGIALLRMGILEKRADANDSNWSWLAKGVIGVIFLVMGAILVLGVTGAFSGS